MNLWTCTSSSVCHHTVDSLQLLHIYCLTNTRRLFLSLCECVGLQSLETFFRLLLCYCVLHPPPPSGSPICPYFLTTSSLSNIAYHLLPMVHSPYFPFHIPKPTLFPYCLHVSPSYSLYFYPSPLIPSTQTHEKHTRTLRLQCVTGLSLVPYLPGGIYSSLSWLSFTVLIGSKSFLCICMSEDRPGNSA